MGPEEVFEWDVESLDAGLKELNITVGATWTKSRKAFELNKAIVADKAKGIEESIVPNFATQAQTSDPSMFMMQALQMIQQQMKEDREAQAQALIQAEESVEAQAQALQALAEKVGGTEDGNNRGPGASKSRAKGRHPEKLDRDVD